MARFEPNIGLDPGAFLDGLEMLIELLIRDAQSHLAKQLDEARGDVVSDYQKYLEKTWLEEIRQKYPVVINRELLKQMTP